MKFPGILVFLLLIIHSGFSQAHSEFQPINRKGNIYIYWGWNRAWYTRSDIHFNGPDYHFSLKHVVASDRPTKFTFNEYFNPLNVTIPQANFRIGYFIKNNLTVSAGFDHMKYVVQQNQVTKISGEIQNTETIYDRLYNDDDITLTEDFLKLEHTNGLNFINIDVRRFDEILDLNKIKINLTEGIGAGILLPKTNTTLFYQNTNNQYHLSGYGVCTVVAVNISFFKNFFIQSELKNGFINMPDIRISADKNEKASQHFFFTQFNILIGATFRLQHKSSSSSPVKYIRERMLL